MHRMNAFDRLHEYSFDVFDGFMTVSERLQTKMVMERLKNGHERCIVGNFGCLGSVETESSMAMQRKIKNVHGTIKFTLQNRKIICKH